MRVGAWLHEGGPDDMGVRIVIEVGSLQRSLTLDAARALRDALGGAIGEAEDFLEGAPAASDEADGATRQEGGEA